MDSLGQVVDNAAFRRYRLFEDCVRILESEVGHPYCYEPHSLLDLFSITAGGRTFSSGEVKRRWLEHFETAPDIQFVNLFLGMPYCVSRCTYCMHHRQKVSGPNDLAEYAKCLRRSIGFFSDVFSRVVFKNIYFGGGTPSLFSARDLEAIGAALAKYVRAHPDAEWTVECNPSSSTPEKFRVLREAGFNRLSLGVQSLNPSVLRGVNRESQTYNSVAQAIRRGQKAGFEEVNTHLIFGLYGDAEPSFLDSFQKLLALEPHTVIVYLVEPTQHYLDCHYGGDLAAFERHIEGQWSYLKKAFDWADRYGFRYSAEYRKNGRIMRGHCLEFFRKDAMRRKWAYTFTKPAFGTQSVLGLGYFANSYLFGRLRYHSLPLQEDPASNTYIGSEFSLKYEMRLAAINGLRGEGLSRRWFRGLFGKHAGSVFAEEFTALKALGLLEDAGDRLSLLPEGALERTASAMFLMDEGQVIEAMNRLLERKKIRFEIGSKVYELMPEISAGAPLGISLAIKGAAVTSAEKKILKVSHRLFERVFGQAHDYAGGMQSFARQMNILADRLSARIL